MGKIIEYHVGDVINDWTIVETGLKHNGKRVSLCKCKCGRTITIVQNTRIKTGKTKQCYLCSNEKNAREKRYNQEEYELKVKELNLGIKVGDNYINSKTKIKHFCSCGNSFMATPVQVLAGNSVRCKECLRKLKKEIRTWSHQEYINELIKRKINIKALEEYVAGNYPILHKCPVCGDELNWRVRPNDILDKKICMCQQCSIKTQESYLANIIKQIAVHKYPNSIFEYDIGFKGNKGGISKYDLYIPDMNYIIEFQSKYHDDKKEHDTLKKKYAEDKGYNYIELDSRDYEGNIKEAIQLLFPDINDIPDYVDLSKITNKSWDIKLVQTLINEGEYSCEKIATMLGISKATIYRSINNGILEKENKKIVKKYEYNIKHIQVMVDQEFSFVEISKKLNITTSIISGLIKKGIVKVKKQIWDRSLAQKLLNEYLDFDEVADIVETKVQNIYKAIQNGTLKSNLDYKRILKINKDMEIVTEYQYLKDTGFNKSTISEICNGKNNHEYKGYLWYYKKDYFKVTGRIS